MAGIWLISCNVEDCGQIFFRCQHCYCGQKYCSPECREQAQRELRREAQKRYVRTPEGQQRVAAASAGYRARAKGGIAAASEARGAHVPAAELPLIFQYSLWAEPPATVVTTGHTMHVAVAAEPEAGWREAGACREPFDAGDDARTQWEPARPTISTREGMIDTGSVRRISPVGEVGRVPVTINGAVGGDTQCIESNSVVRVVEATKVDEIGHGPHSVIDKTLPGTASHRYREASTITRCGLCGRSGWLISFPPVAALRRKTSRGPQDEPEGRPP